MCRSCWNHRLARHQCDGGTEIHSVNEFDVTGHPAMSLPCGMVDGLPVGVMLIGRYYAEKTIYRAAHAYEQDVDWRSE
jgi:amidase